MSVDAPAPTAAPEFTDDGAVSAGDRQWTQAQREGIETVGRSLLVSAAAGSGKTTVLAERCVHLVCDAEDPCAVDELLVVTFTVAAAAEMKDRIARALALRHARHRSQRTQRQLAIMDRASVGTLHAFCSRLLRQHFHLLGLDPNFVLLDTDEADLMKLEVARQMFADYYEMEDNADTFRRLVDSYGDGNDERLVELVIKSHDTLRSVIDPEGWLTSARARLQEAIDLPLVESELGRAFIQSIRRQLDALCAACADAGKAVKQLHNFEGYVVYLRELYKVLNHWVRVLDGHGLDALVEVAAMVDLPKAPPFSNSLAGKEVAQGRVRAITEAMKKGPWRQCLHFSAEQWKDGLRRSMPHAETFLGLIEEFTARYQAAKEEEGGLDFSDLERLTLKALLDEDSSSNSVSALVPSAVARSYHRQFKHVLVDEYQDINEVQDAILSLISRECVTATRGIVPNLFCVGDVKQSIYRFRLAEPQRFLSRRKAYTAAGAHGAVVDLQQNFRSRAPLLNAINGVFERLMTAEAADLNYDESQRLKPGLRFPTGTDAALFTGSPIELHLLPKDGGSSATSDDEETGVDLDRSEREAMLLARRILEMTGRLGTAMQVFDRPAPDATPRPIRFGDIVILLRSMRYKADQFAEALRRAGIPVHSQSATGYFEATEINDVLSLLKVLDNQRQDIPLAAVLRSPFASLPQTEDQLGKIRLAYGGTPPVAFHEAVVRYATEQQDELAARLRDFRRQLDQWRRLARQRPLAEVLWTIYDQTGYLAFCAGLPGGEQRQANLIELHERARQFGSFRRQGLSRFLQFLEKLKTDSDLGQASIASEAENVVRIMSIHRSKGLEFPVVLLPDLGKAFNLTDAQGSILLDRHAGIGLQVVDDERRIRYPSLASTVVQRRLKQQSLAEELRVLYVAMTRAKEHLIMVGTCREDAAEGWVSQWRAHQGPLPAEKVLGARSMLDWIGPTAAMLSSPGRESFDVRMHTPQEIASWSQLQARSGDPTDALKELAALRPLNPPPAMTDAAQDVIHRVSSEYSHSAFTKEAAAKAMTAMAKAAPAARDDEPASATDPGALLDRVLPRPAFLAGELPPDAADRGTATHAVLEHLDFTRAGDDAAIREQIDSMVGNRRITPEQAKLVDIAAIEWLMQDEVGRRLRASAAGLLREVPVYFAVPAQAGASTDPLDQVMLRGRLDLLLPEEGGYLIVDYKTDRVRGEQLEARTELYARQLQLYRDAIERLTGRKVTGAIIVFLNAHECRRV